MHPASATALCSASGHTLVVKCDTVVAENVLKQLWEQGVKLAPLNVKMLENKYDPERMVLATYASSAERQAAQSFFERLEGLQFIVQDEAEQIFSYLHLEPWVTVISHVISHNCDITCDIKLHHVI